MARFGLVREIMLRSVIDNQTHVLADILKDLLADPKGRSLDDNMA